MQIVSTVKLNGNQLQNGLFHVLAAAPSAPAAGQFYWDSVLLGPRFFNGSTWTNNATDSLLLGGFSSSYHLNRANHSGQQVAATISDLATTVKAYKLSDFAVPTANIPMGGFTFTGLSTPNAAGQAAEYSWVLSQISSASSGIKAIKDPVRAYFAVQTALTGIPTTGAADGLTLAAGDRVLLNGQTTGSENGIWTVQTGAWVRATDADASTEIVSGTEVLVNEGTTYGGSVWRIATTGAITPGTTAIAWQQVNKLNTYTGGNGILLTGSAFSAVVVASGGLSVSGAGLAVDRTKVPMLFAATIGDGTQTSFTVTHNLNTQDVTVAVRDVATNTLVQPDIVAATVNTITVTFAGIVPAANSYRVVVHG